MGDNTFFLVLLRFSKVILGINILFNELFFIIFLFDLKII